MHPLGSNEATWGLGGQPPLGLAGPPQSLPAAPLQLHKAWGWRMLNYFGKLLLCSSRSGLVLCMMLFVRVVVRCLNTSTARQFSRPCWMRVEILWGSAELVWQ